MSYNELKQHGNDDFPVQLYEVNNEHPKYEMASHWHTHLEIIKVVSGKMHLFLNGHEQIMASGDIAFVNMETVHSAVPEDCVYECVVFSPDVISSPSEKSQKFLIKATNHIIHLTEFIKAGDSPFHKAIDFLFDSLKNHESHFLTTSALHLIFGIIQEEKMYTIFQKSETDKRISSLKDVLYFIRNSYDTAITLEDMAEKAGMSPKYFCKFFKEMTDKTPFEYLNNYRIERAARRLIKSEFPITEVAFSCGFNDLSYFTKTFKRHKGVTPREFKKNYR